MPKFGFKSKQRLSTCHSDLQRLFNEVVKHVDCSVLCGVRTEEEQQKAYLRGFSHAPYPKSLHNRTPSPAVDVVPYPIDWEDKERFYRFAGFVQGVASQMGIELQWGGDFISIFDAPHYQLNQRK